MLACRNCAQPVRIFLHMDTIFCKACVKVLVPQISVIAGFKAQHIHSDLRPVDDQVIRHDLGRHDFS